MKMCPGSRYEVGDLDGTKGATKAGGPQHQMDMTIGALSEPDHDGRDGLPKCGNREYSGDANTDDNSA